MITSPHNDKLKEIRRLQRHAEERFVAVGEDLVAGAERITAPTLPGSWTPHSATQSGPAGAAHRPS